MRVDLCPLLSYLGREGIEARLEVRQFAARQGQGSRQTFPHGVVRLAQHVCLHGCAGLFEGSLYVGQSLIREARGNALLLVFCDLLDPVS
ncbi:MAG: hypothetical protein ABI895_15000 [Deltaproteobacteria bacterium]